MHRLAFLLLCLAPAMLSQNKSDDNIKDAVTRMARVGRCGSPSFSPDETSIYPVFQQRMSEVNSPGFQPTPGTLVREFALDKYFPDAETQLRGSTLRGYKAIWRNYVEPRLGHRRVRDLRTFDCQQAMDSIVRENPELRQASLSRVKSFMSAVFNEAIRLGLRDDDKNPVASDRSGNGGIKIKCAKSAKRKTETFAYSIDDIRTVLDALTGLAKVLVAIAAYTGLRRGEIVGLQWGDYDGKNIWVRRNICFGERGEMSVELPKTEASAAPVPAIAPLRDILDKWKAQTEGTLDGCWIFQAGFTRKKDHPVTLLDAARMTPLSPANVLRDVVLPALEKEEIEWHGYHAFRRGLATNLRSLGVDDLTISEILRHSDVAVTGRNYIKRINEKSVEAMSRFENEVRKPAQSERTAIARTTAKPKADAVVPVGMA
jgi:integrase